MFVMECQGRSNSSCLCVLGRGPTHLQYTDSPKTASFLVPKSKAFRTNAVFGVESPSCVWRGNNRRLHKDTTMTSNALPVGFCHDEYAFRGKYGSFCMTEACHFWQSIKHVKSIETLSTQVFFEKSLWIIQKRTHIIVLSNLAKPKNCNLMDLSV